MLMDMVTGETAEISGDYKFMRHLHNDNCRCVPTSNESVISLEKNETFPPIKSCESAVVWRFVGRTNNHYH